MTPPSPVLRSIAPLPFGLVFLPDEGLHVRAIDTTGQATAGPVLEVDLHRRHDLGVAKAVGGDLTEDGPRELVPGLLGQAHARGDRGLLGTHPFTEPADRRSIDPRDSRPGSLPVALLARLLRHPGRPFQNDPGRRVSVLAGLRQRDGDTVRDRRDLGSCSEVVQQALAAFASEILGDRGRREPEQVGGAPGRDPEVLHELAGDQHLGDRDPASSGTHPFGHCARMRGRDKVFSV